MLLNLHNRFLTVTSSALIGLGRCVSRHSVLGAADMGPTDISVRTVRMVARGYSSATRAGPTCTTLIRLGCLDGVVNDLLQDASKKFTHTEIRGCFVVCGGICDEWKTGLVVVRVNVTAQPDSYVTLQPVVKDNARSLDSTNPEH